MARAVAFPLLVLAAAIPALAGPSDGYAVVVPPEDHPRAEAVRAALGPLLEHRRGEGLEVVVLQPPADAPTRSWIREAVGARAPRFLLLVGDAAAVPTWIVEGVATDRPYGDADGDGYPEVSVGRIPWSDPAAVARVVERTLHYEREVAPGLWQKEVALVAGEGGFSPAIDGAIEHVFQQVVAESIHPGYDLDLTYANPRSRFCYPPAGFADRVLERLDAGPLLFAYVGHGAERSVDALDVEGPGGEVERYRVLDAGHLSGLDGPGPASVFVAIACWTARLDGARPSIGAELLAAPGGPVAFLGATRVSHPVHNALLARELVRELLTGTGPLRLGPALDRARRSMVEGPGSGEPDPVRLQVLTLGRAFAGREAVERDMSRHVDMYALLGDPALRLARPAAGITLDAPPRARPGDSLEVTGALPLPGPRAVTLTLEVSRERSARPEPAEGETPLERYARANDRVLATAVVRAGPDGRFRATLEVPVTAPPGGAFVKAFAAGDEASAAGAAACPIAAPTRPAPPPAPAAPAAERRFY